MISFIYCRLSENIKEVAGGNLSLEKICSAFKNEKTQGIKDPKSLSNLVLKLFPNAVRSTTRSKVDGKPVNSYRNVVLASHIDRSEVLFENLENMIPNDWFVLKREADTLVFGHFLNIQFNGRNSFLQLKISRSNKISICLDNKDLDCLLHYNIPQEVDFNISSVPALFRCMKVIRPCQGYDISNNENKYTNISKCTKEICEQNGETVTILRSKDCNHFIQLMSRSSVCEKCQKVFRNKNYYCKSKISDKENVCQFSTEEVLEKLKILAPNLKQNQITLIHSQIIASNTSKTGMRWDKDVICIALSLYNRNPAAYRDLTQNNWLHLPCESLLQRYKNAVHQKPGISFDMMSWMNNEAKSQNLTVKGYYGGLILDEMAIQEDLQIVNNKNETKFIGLSDSGTHVKQMQVLNTRKAECELANHVLQFVFTGLTGFRWPFANFPNTQAPPADIFLTFWTCVDALHSWGFQPIYSSLDGSANNRAFVKMHFPDNNPAEHKMIAKCYKNPTRTMIFLMDPSHLIKKIRNSVLSSGFLSSHQRLLTVNGHYIIWKMWVDAYQWDCTNGFRIHHKLSDEHIFPNNAQKMRNKLAFETLDLDMLNLMTCYSQTLNAAGQAEMTSVLQFLKYTSSIVSLFNDSRPIKDINDTRLKSFTEVYNYFKAWESEHLQDDEKNKRHKSLITMETREDIDFTYHGFMSLVKKSLLELKIEIAPSRINSDIIENIFCQQRALYHGANTNPNYNEYRTGINSIILGQTTTSTKSNAGKHSAKPFALSLPPKRPKTET